MTAPQSTRGVVWAYLVITPGQTAHEIARCALGKRGPTSASIQSGSTRELLLRMEKAGQVTRHSEYRPQQGRHADLWYAVPGAFAIGGTS